MSDRPLLTAKLLLPRPGQTAIVRPRLHERLQESRHCRLTTVVAPAGWGKSTLLALRARGQQAAEQRVAWAFLDDADDEPVRFWTYVLSALDAAPRPLCVRKGSA